MRVGESSGSGTGWVPRDTIENYWKDGSSVQIVVGEKHIPFKNLGQCATTGFSAYDCNNWFVGTRGQYNASTFHIARAMQMPFNADGSETGTETIHNSGDSLQDRQTLSYVTLISTQATTFDDTGGGGNDPYEHFSFGSYHPGACMFLFGDGAVKAIPNTASPLVLTYLTIVDDNNYVTIP
jgi:prepilin-type processing-associated H-X9-DG protein